VLWPRWTPVLVSFAVVLTAYWLYALVVVPWIEPAIQLQSQGALEQFFPESDPERQILEALFPPGAWELDQPKVFESRQTKLLFKDYTKQTPNTVELRPCTLIFLPEEPDLTLQERAGRAVVMEVPDGAVLEFDQPLDLTQGKMGRLVRGQLRGIVRIRCQGRSAGPEDDLRITTREVRLSQNEISSPEKVECFWGPHFARGQDLHIELSPGSSASGGLTLGGLQTLEVRRVELVHIEVPAEASRSLRPTASRSRGSAGPVPKEKPSLPSGKAASGQPAGVATASSADRSASEGDGESPLAGVAEITCKGPFRFDAKKWEASFAQQVLVQYRTAEGPTDTLRCDRLLVVFQPQAAAASKNPGVQGAGGSGGPGPPPSSGVKTDSSSRKPSVPGAPPAGLSGQQKPTATAQVKSPGAEPASSNSASASKSSAITSKNSDTVSQKSGTPSPNSVSASQSSAPASKNFDTVSKNSAPAYQKLFGTASKKSDPSRSVVRLEPQRLEAIGQPVILEAPSRQTRAVAERLEYHLSTGRILLQAPQDAWICHGPHEIHAPKLDYTPGVGGQLGQGEAEGAGWLRAETDPRTARNIQARWTQAFQLRPLQGQPVLSLLGQAEVLHTGIGQLDAEQIHLWIHQQPAPGQPASPQVLAPDRLLAEGNVLLRHPQVTAEVDRLEAWFELAGPIPAPPGVPQQPRSPAGGPLGFPQQPVPPAARTPGFPKEPDPSGGLRPDIPQQPDGPRAKMPVSGVSPARARLHLGNDSPNGPWWETPAEGSDGFPSPSPGPRGAGFRPTSWTQKSPELDADPPAVRQPEVPEDSGWPPAASLAPPSGQMWEMRGDFRPTAFVVSAKGPPEPAGESGPSAFFVSPGPPPAMPVDSLPPGSPPPGQPIPQHFEVRCKLLRALIILAGQQTELKELILEGEVSLKETQTSRPGENPLVVIGRQIHVLDASRPYLALTVQGQPAHVEARGLALNGPAINLHRGTNRLWIDGPGWMSLPMDRDLHGRPVGRATQIEVHWQHRMEFDGRSARFDESVLASSPGWQLRTDSLEVQLREPVVFTSPHPASNVQVHRLICRSDVLLENRSWDAQGELSRDQIEVADLTVDLITGDLTAGGPGVFRSVRRSQKKQAEGNPSGQTEPANAGKPIRPGPFRPDASDTGLLFLSVEFQRSLVGNLHRREIGFSDRVRTIYGPVTDWQERIPWSQLAALPPQVVFLSCDQLSVAELALPPSGQRFLEMVAVGNTVIESAGYTARAHRLSYTEDKGLVVLEGDGRADAELFRQQRPGAPRERVAARKIYYWPQTNHLSLDSASLLEVLQPDQKR